MQTTGLFCAVKRLRLTGSLDPQFTVHCILDAFFCISSSMALSLLFCNLICHMKIRNSLEDICSRSRRLTLFRDAGGSPCELCVGPGCNICQITHMTAWRWPVAGRYAACGGPLRGWGAHMTVMCEKLFFAARLFRGCRSLIQRGLASAALLQRLLQLRPLRP